MTIEYGNNQTVFTDEVNHTTLITQFNDFGNTISVQDDEGRAQYAQFARNDANDTAGKGNQLTLSSKMQNTVINLLSDSSLGQGDGSLVSYFLDIFCICDTLNKGDFNA